MDLAQALSPSGDRRPWVIASLLAVDTVANRASVSIDGSLAVWLPYVPGTYTGATTVFVLRDPHSSGAGQLVLGPAGVEAVPAVPPPAAPAAPEAQDPLGAGEQATVLIRPTWSGTYRVIRAAWDRWNTDRYGGRSTLYQGDSFGSGTLKGMAVYGTAVRDLGALRIVSIVVSTPIATGSGSVVLQGSPSGTKPAGAPSVSGATASGTTSVSLPSPVCESFRTGDLRGLVSNGASYRGTYGTSKANGMTLAVTYIRPL